jgi:hypothetical protein
MQDFVNHVGDVLASFANIVQPRTFEDLQRYGFDDHVCARPYAEDLGSPDAIG